MRTSPMLFLFVVLASSAGAVTIHVPQDKATIRAGLEIAVAGDTVQVASGVYLEHDLSLRSGVTLRGGEGKAPDDVVIDGGGLGTVLRCEDLAEGPWIVGLTLRGGAAPPGADHGGGGLHCSGSGPIVTRCRFADNRGAMGGGAGCFESSPVFTACEFLGNSALAESWAAGGGLFCRDAAVVLEDCLFVANVALSTSLPGDGGGIFSQHSSVTATRCTFRANSSGAGGGAMYSYDQDQPSFVQCTFEDNASRAGGAAYLERSFARFDACVLTGNAAANGGALFMAQWSVPSLSDCRFEGNVAHTYSGGAVDCWVSLPLFEDCAFVANSASLDGGALMCNGMSQATVRRCVFVGNAAGRCGGALRSLWATAAEVTSSTLAGNSAPTGGGIRHEQSGPLTLDRTVVAFSKRGEAVSGADTSRVVPTCCVLWGNAGGDWVGCLEGQEHVAGNVAADPLLCDLVAGIVTVSSPDSPCLPPNNSCGQLLGALPAGCGTGTAVREVFERASWGRIKAAFRE